MWVRDSLLKGGDARGGSKKGEVGRDGL